VLDLLAVSGVVCLSFRDRFDILLEKRLSGVAEQGHTMLSGKCQIVGMKRNALCFLSVLMGNVV